MPDGSPKANWKDAKGFVIGGVLLIVVALVCNPFVVGLLYGPDHPLSRTNRFLIVLGELAVASAGIWLIRKRRWPDFSKGNVARAYSSFAVLLLNTVLFFIVINVLISWLRPRAHGLPINYVPVQEMLGNNPALFHRLYPGSSERGITEREEPPNITSHPTLEFMELPTTSEMYNVGLENMRYTRFVNASNARDKINGSTWVFGGSTTFGHGVADNETIAAYLNVLDSPAVYVNFGVQAYDQNLEIEKLILLLKKGYRPAHVIFIDGLNDIVEMNQMNFKPEEMPCRLYDAYTYRSNIESVMEPDRQFMARQIPLFDLLFSYIDKGRIKQLGAPDPLKEEDLDNASDLYHVDPVLHYKVVTEQGEDYDAAMRNIDVYKRKLMKYYRLNNAFLQNLSSAFGFTYAVCLQPLGPLSPENPFHLNRATFRDDPRYHYCLQLLDTVRSAIAQNALPNFHDVSTADRACPDCYVDFTHYAPSLCRQIASEILASSRPQQRLVAAKSRK